MQSDNLIGRQIKKLRTDQDMTMFELSQKLNVSKQTIYNWEHGNKLPRIQMLKEIANMFNTSIGYITDGVVAKYNKFDIKEFIDNDEDLYYNGKKLSKEDLKILVKILS